MNKEKNIFHLMCSENFFATHVSSVFCSLLYVFISYIFRIMKCLIFFLLNFILKYFNLNSSSCKLLLFVCFFSMKVNEHKRFNEKKKEKCRAQRIIMSSFRNYTCIFKYETKIDDQRK